MLLAQGITKRFPGVQALAGVDFDVRPGEVHALMGQNGAGKSTLLKILTGAHPPDGGTIALEGRPFAPTSPADAQRRGIGAIYQEINLVPSLSVAENLFLGRAPRRWWGIDWRTVKRRARELLAGFDLEIDVEQPLGRCPVAYQQVVAIARAVDTDARILVMDEPTSSLDRHETELLFALIRRLKERGLGIVFVTHFIDQVYRISDRITVLRNGAKVGTFEAAALPKAQLVEHMIGRTVGESRKAAAPPAAETLMEARGLHRRGAIEAFDLSIGRGEVLGLAGLLGSGRTEMARLLFGADRPNGGTVEIAGREVALRSPRHAIALGLALCPEDRKTEGIVADMSVRDNLVLAVQRRLSRLGIVSRRLQDRVAQEFVRALGIVTPSLDVPVGNLSGGNQQKVILARWLACRPKLLILDEPTRGIDVGAKAEVERLVEQLSAEGMSILFISAELEEVVRRSHRIAVLRDRKKVGELAGSQIGLQTVMKTIAGEGPHAA